MRDLVRRALARVTHEIRTVGGWPFWLLLVSALCMVVVAVGYHQTQFVPDSRYYVAMSYHFSGMDQDEAYAATVDAFDGTGFEIPETNALFNAPVVTTRVVYPALSVPFLLAIGPKGMVVVPVLGIAFFVLASAWLVVRRYGRSSALVCATLVLTSFYVMRFSVAALTEGLAVALTLGAVLTLPIWEARRRRALVTFVVLMVTLEFTRQSSMLPAAAVLAAWLGASMTARTWRNRWTPFVLAAAVTSVVMRVAMAFSGGDRELLSHFESTTGVSSWRDYPAGFIDGLMYVIKRDLTSISGLDRPLLILIVLSWVAALVMWRRVESHMFLGAMLATGLVSGLSSVPTQFRYVMPALVFFVLVSASLLQSMRPGTTTAATATIDSVAGS